MYASVKLCMYNIVGQVIKQAVREILRLCKILRLYVFAWVIYSCIDYSILYHTLLVEWASLGVSCPKRWYS